MALLALAGQGSRIRPRNRLLPLALVGQLGQVDQVGHTDQVHQAPHHSQASQEVPSAHKDQSHLSFPSPRTCQVGQLVLVVLEVRAFLGALLGQVVHPFPAVQLGQAYHMSHRALATPSVHQGQVAHKGPFVREDPWGPAHPWGLVLLAIRRTQPNLVDHMAPVAQALLEVLVALFRRMALEVHMVQADPQSSYRLVRGALVVHRGQVDPVS